MGSCFSGMVEPTALNETELDGTGISKISDDFKGPVKKRSCTDVSFLTIMGLFVVVLMALLSYCISHGDIHRIVNGYDNCGNVCGRITLPEPDKSFPCKGADMTDKKYLLIQEAGRAIVNLKNVVRKCVRSCNEEPNFKRILNRCIPEKSNEVVNSFFSKTGVKNFFQEASEDLHECWTEILYLCLIALVLSVILLLLLRYMTGYVVWMVLVGVVVTSISGTIYLWAMWQHKKSAILSNSSDIEQRKEYLYFVGAILATIATVVILLVVLVMRKRIALVVELFTEAGKAINSMPLLLLEPLLTFASLAVVVSLWLYLSLWVETSGFLSATPQNNFYYYKKDTTMKVTRWYNFMAMLWFTQFCIACQHMVIAGAVATWFFTRNKTHISSPISTSFYNVVRYHLGSVALGSLLVALVQLARAGLKYLQSAVEKRDNDVTRCLFRTCHCCLYCFEKVLAYISRNAYIEIAIYGENFCTGGQQAFKMLTANLLRLAAINSVGDFVLFLGKAFVVGATVLCGFKMIEEKDNVHHMWVPVTLAGLFAYFVSHCFITVYEMTIDTIFLCFCEDCEMNDGISKPYFMSRGLMEFVENSKKVLSVGDGAKPNWSPETVRQTSP